MPSISPGSPAQREKTFLWEKESKLSPRCHCRPQSWPVQVGLSQHEADFHRSSPGADTCLHLWPQEPESEVTQSFQSLCDSMDCSLPTSSIHDIFQTRILECVAISLSRGSRPRHWTWVFYIVDRLFTVWVTRKSSWAPNGILFKFQVGSHKLKTQLSLLLPQAPQGNFVVGLPGTQTLISLRGCWLQWLQEAPVTPDFPIAPGNGAHCFTQAVTGSRGPRRLL